jgi:hypothetical protein
MRYCLFLASLLLLIGVSSAQITEQKTPVPPSTSSTVGQTPEGMGYVSDVQAASVTLTATGTTTLNVPSALFTAADVGKTIIISGAGTDLLAGANTGTITGGSSYTAGTYAYVPLTCSSCADSKAAAAYATITVSGGGAVTNVDTSTGNGQEGYYYTIGDTLTTPNSFIGGTGSGFVWTVTTTSQAPLRTTITAFNSSTQVILGAAMNSHLSSNTCGGTTCREYIYWGGKSGSGGVNDVGTKINAAWATGTSTVRVVAGLYGQFTTIVPPITRQWHLRCDPGAIIVALGPMSAVNANDNNAPFNTQMFVNYAPSGSANGSLQQNYGSTVEGCNFEGAMVVANNIVTMGYKTNFINDTLNDAWGGTNSYAGPGYNLTIRNHAQGSIISGVNMANGTTAIPNFATTVQQQIGPAGCLKIADTDVIAGPGFCNAYAYTSVLLTHANTITATVSSGSPNLTVTATTDGVHIGDHLYDGSGVGQSLIPAGTVIISGPVGGQTTKLFTTTITSGSASVATSAQSLTSGMEVVFVCTGSCTMGTITGLVPGTVYYVNSTGLSSTTVQLCVLPSCVGGSIVPAGGGTASPIGQGMFTGVVGSGSQTFVMSNNATGNSSGSDTIKVGDLIGAAFQADGGGAAHVFHFHSFQASGMTALGPCWQADATPAMLSPNDQCDSQAAVQDGLNIRYASAYVEGFFSNISGSGYIGQRGVRIDPSANANPQNSIVIGVVQQGYSGTNVHMFQDNSQTHNNLLLTANGCCQIAGTVNPTLANDDGTLMQANDPGGSVNNYIIMQPAVTGTPAGISVQTNGAGSASDLTFNLSAKNAAAGSNFAGGVINLNGGNGDSTVGDNQAGGNANVAAGNGFGTGVGGSININSGNGGASGASGAINIKASATGSSVGAIQIAQASAGAVNIAVGASSGTVHINDGTGTGNVVIGNGSNQVKVATALQSTGTTFTLGTGTGACATSSTLTGGTQAGSFVCTGTAGASTQVINLPSAPHAWACTASDVTSGTAWSQSAANAGSCKISGTIAVTSDVVVFFALAY